MALTKTFLDVALKDLHDYTLESLDKDTAIDFSRNTAGAVLDGFFSPYWVIGSAVDEAIECL